MNKKSQGARRIVFTILLCVFLFLLGFVLSIFYEDFTENQQLKLDREYNYLVDNVNKLCGDLELNETAYCLRDFINRNYNYFYEDESEAMKRGAVDIYENGGDCLGYSILYSKLIDSLYYESEIIINPKEQHAYVKMYNYWSKDNYCILDLINEPKCFINEAGIK